MDMCQEQYNIVIVDDEQLVTSNLKTLLRLENYPTPNIFNSPVDALEYVRNNKVDLVISDFFMPEMNGIDFLKQVRKLHQQSTLILLTGYADKESAIKAINEVGLYRYIEKPWDNEDLLLCIKNGLERSDFIAQQELERLRDDFIATLTHDLRTPLLAAIQTLKFFVDGTLGVLTERQKTLLETMIYSNQDMLGLVNALLEVYKYESGQLVLCKDNFVLKDLIDQCSKEIESLLIKKNMKLSINNISDEKIYGDKQEIKRVISNFLGNAIKHTSQNGEIRILGDFNNTDIVISIEDTGFGIPKDDIPKLFKRFSQGTKTKRSTSTGLGLYLSRQIIEAHGGKVWLESELNVGSKFKFSIPQYTKN
jgi:two-component system sensor histidine kinase/response regulator